MEGRQSETAGSASVASLLRQHSALTVVRVVLSILVHNC